MEAIYIPRLLKAPSQTEVLEIKEFLPELETLTPVSGQLKVTHCGNYLQVAATTETIVTLTCDRCLQQYNYRLASNSSELIWLQENSNASEPALEVEVAFEDLVETLPPQGYFSPQDWIYQQLCLALPQRQLCDQECAGITPVAETTSPITDRRWAALEALKNTLSQ